jgi:hypothetical protein
MSMKGSRFRVYQLGPGLFVIKRRVFWFFWETVAYDSSLDSARRTVASIVTYPKALVWSVEWDGWRFQYVDAAWFRWFKR